MVSPPTRTSVSGRYRSVVIVALIALAVGCVSKLMPELFLRIPKIGWIFYSFVTGAPPPPFFSSEPWEEDEIKTWIKERDVVIATGFKSGTHWMQYCVHQIRVKASDDADELFGEVNYAVPWIELVHNPGWSWARHKPLYNTTTLPNGKLWNHHWDHSRYPFRMFKSHYGPKEEGGVLPVTTNPGVKFLAMSRNGLDVVRSAIPFLSETTEEFCSMWGGMCPQSKGNAEKDAEERLVSLMPGGILDRSYFPYVKQWWPLRHEENVLLLHFADAKRDLSDIVRKISNFVGVDLTPEEHRKVVRRCGFDHMKSIDHRFNTSVPLNTRYPNLQMMKAGSSLRSGKSGEGRHVFTAEQRARWEAAENAEFADEELIRWAREGGGFS